jgi:predicted Rossmann fold flavoprotein
MAGIFAARSGREVILVEGSADGGRKILISGGGRCNVLPGTFRPEAYGTDSSSNTLRKLLRSWPLPQQRAFFEDDLGIPLKHEPEFDKLFPVSDRARDVRDSLIDAFRSAGGKLWLGTRVTGLAPGWTVDLSDGQKVFAESVILASGGLSVPATGSDGWGLEEARRLGHAIHPTYPALTPLLAGPPVHAALAGLTLPVRIRASGGGVTLDETGSFLFTHRGYSGPVALNVSHAVSRAGSSLRDPPGDGADVRIRVQWSPAMDRSAWEDALSSGGSSTVANTLREHLPRRLVDQLLTELSSTGLPSDRTLATLRRNERKALVTALSEYPLPVTGDEGYRKAEVTGGGVALDQVHPRTMESRVTPGLYLCGEILDAFGPIGGHNFLWAWATGRAAGLGAGRAEANAGD